MGRLTKQCLLAFIIFSLMLFVSGLMNKQDSIGEVIKEMPEELYLALKSKYADDYEVAHEYLMNKSFYDKQIQSWENRE